MKRILIKAVDMIGRPVAFGPGGATDILVEGDRIAAIGPHIVAPDAEVVDGAGRIAIPGLVNAHMHSWQTGLRGLSLDWTLLDYVGWMHGKAAPLFTPEDLAVGTLAGALNQINCGTTTLGDWCHNAHTPAHADAAVAALEQSGIRAQFFLGAPPNRDLARQREELGRLLASPAFAKGGRLTLGLAVMGPLYSPPGVAREDLLLARELGLICSMHHSGGPPATEVWDALIQEGLFDARVNIVHANTMPDDLLARLAAAGVTFTITPEVELNDGHGHPITGRLRDLGRSPSIGIDIESGVSGEMLIAARIALAHQRALDFDGDPLRLGAPLAHTRLRGLDALGWATIEGARALGLEDRIGSLEPGKQADLVLIDARTLGLWPNHDPVATVLHATSANVEAVMIAGVWRKFAGRLTYPGLASLQQQLATSAARIRAVAGPLHQA